MRKYSEKLHFNETKPPTKLSNAALTSVRRELRKDDDDNSATEAANTGVEVAGYSSHSYSRWRQKQEIKKAYIAAKRGQQAAFNTAQTINPAQKAVKGTKKAGEFLVRNKKGLIIAGAIAAVLLFMLGAVSSCSLLFQNGMSSVGSTTYPSEDVDMLEAEAKYCQLETELREFLDDYEAYHDYDEYHFEIDEIKHDPYVLISAVTALHGGSWTVDEVGEILELLFERQYILTESVNDGVCTVKLTNFNLSHVPVYVMTEEELAQYAAFMGTLGGRPDLFPDSEYVDLYSGNYEKYEIPPSALEDEIFAAIIAEAEKYLGMPYVWGGSNPSTSFDCSGFVSWVVNNCGVGWSIGRLSAQGLCDYCTLVTATNAKPGDLIFFKGTYDTPNVSHVGIYVGGNRMLHCGDPIQYADLTDDYWQEHFYAFGRLPNP